MHLDRRFRAVYAILGMTLLAGLSFFAHAPATPLRSTGLWIEPLTMVVLAAFLFEPNYSGTGPALTNGVAAIFIVVQAWFRVYPWWAGLAGTASIVVVSLVLDRLLSERHTSRSADDRLAEGLRALGMTLGSWRILLISSVVLTLASFNPPFAAPWGISAALVLYTGVLSLLAPHRLLLRLADRDKRLQVLRLSPPNEVVVGLEGASDLRVGDVVEVRSPSGRATQALAAAGSFADDRTAIRLMIPRLAEFVEGEAVEVVEVRRIQDRGTRARSSCKRSGRGSRPSSHWGAV